MISDVSGSLSSKGRGMGIPSPILAWSNDIIVIREIIEEKQKIPISEFAKSFAELAVKMFEKGYDVRFQTAQAILVFINEMVVRLLYSIRRLIKYFITIPKEERSLSLLWKSCESFSNATVKRMLTVAHGTFCLIDIGDESIRAIATGAGNDKDLFSFVDDFQKCNLYKDAFVKSVQLAKLRNVPDEKSVKSKAEIDNYFRGGSVCTTEKNQN